MRYLLDTHILIWSLFSDEKLSSKAKQLINNLNNELYYSTASVWEITIKHSKSPVKMPVTGKDLVDFCKKAGFAALPITDAHAIGVSRLKRLGNVAHHSDPFDRMLISQAKAEKLILLTHDSLLDGYGEDCVSVI